MRWPLFAKCGLVVVLLAVLFVPFANKPVHIDDANFLMLAEGAARDPWRPHSILINWSGVTEPAFDILANPPGIAWYLAPVRTAPDWVMHAAMLPWLLLAAWGCGRLGRAYAPEHGFAAAIYLLTCPVIVLAAQALTPDLPLFACVVAGVGGFVTTRRRTWAFALLAGCAALFRYSGGAMIPLLMVIGWRRHGWSGAAAALFAAVPIVALILHDMHAYDKIHLFTMFLSQNDPVQRPLSKAIHNWIAGLAMLGGAGVLPVLIWRKETLLGALVGAGIGLDAAFLSGQSTLQAIPTVVFTAAGAGAVVLAFSPHARQLDLSLWALGGCCFFFLVRFAATRYWAAFVPGAGLLAVRNAASRPRWLALGILVNVLVSLGMAIDDQNFARSCRDAAFRVAAHGTGTFSGHWGWQHYLEAAGWTPIERNGQPGELYASPRMSAPQMPDRDVCLKLIERFEMPDNWWGPRVHSRYMPAGYHSGSFGRYAPWAFSDEPYEVVTICRRCESDHPTTDPSDTPAEEPAE